MKGIILAGGSGTRMYPMTKAVSKQLLPVFDKPLIYYPLVTLMESGIQDILIITTPEDQAQFIRLLGDGSQFGLKLKYKAQPSPDGLAQAFILGEEFIGDDTCAMVLGDNIFYGAGIADRSTQARKNAEQGKATIFGYPVRDPWRFGIMELDNEGNVISVEEKPEKPKSDYCITGLYFYPKGVSEMAKNVKPSPRPNGRSELEITTLNDMYLQKGNLKAEVLPTPGHIWYDTGTDESMKEAADFIHSVQKQGDCIVSCPEAVGLKKGWLTAEQLLATTELITKDANGDLVTKNTYGAYLKKVLRRK